MAKVVVQFTCTECGTTAGRWLGRCPGCGAFGTLLEELTGRDSEPRSGARTTSRDVIRLADVRADEQERISSGVPELDRVLGGGIVPASLILVGGEPGVGKSTLLLSALGAVAQAGGRALLVTGEESPAQVEAPGRPAWGVRTTSRSSPRRSSRLFAPRSRRSAPPSA